MMEHLHEILQQYCVSMDVPLRFTVRQTSEKVSSLNQMCASRIVNSVGNVCPSTVYSPHPVSYFPLIP